MTYNVENLFDSFHDPGKNDWARLPLAEKENNPTIQNECKKIKNPYYRTECFFLDWNADVVDNKLYNIGAVIRSYNDGVGPDILVLQEVENIHILAELRDRVLYDLGYQEVVLLEGPDERGIDVAILSKFPLAESPKNHIVDLSQIGYHRSTRSILEAVFRVGRKKLSIFANHWPSQGNPDEARLLAAQTLYQEASQKSHAVIAAGDFNTLQNDSPNGIEEIITNAAQGFHFYDTRRWEDFEFFGPTGTHWYRGHWNYLDKIFISADSVNKQVEPISFNVYAPSFLFTEKQWSKRKDDPSKVETHWVPKRFDSKTGEGFSDHLPAVFKFVM